MRVLIVSADQFEDSELLEPRRQLKDKSVVVDVASPKTPLIKGKHGATVKAVLRVKDAVPSNYDMLILPGGKAPSLLRNEREVVELTRAFLLENKPVAAICHGPQILISTGLFAGRTATCYRGIADELKGAGVHYKNEEVVVDGNLITSRHPGDLPAFMREIFRLLRIND